MYYNTENVKMGYSHYCSYCGKELEGNNDYQDYELIETYYHCNCKLANLEKEKLEKIEQVNKEANQKIYQIEQEYFKKGLKTDRNFVNQIKFNHELDNLKRQYQIKS